MKRFFIALFFMPLILSNLYAQPEVIIMAVDADNGKGIEGVEIRIKELTTGPQTTKNQKIVYFNGLKNSNISIVAEKGGYKPYERTFNLEPDKPFIKIEMVKDPESKPIKVIGEVKDQNGLSVANSDVVLTIASLKKSTTTDKSGQFEFWLNKGDFSYISLNLRINSESCNEKSDNHDLTKSDMDNIYMYGIYDYKTIKLDCAEGVNSKYDKFAIEMASNPKSKTEIQRSAKYFFSKSKFRDIVSQLISLSDSSNFDTEVCEKIIIDKIAPYNSYDLLGKYKWGDNIYYKSLARINVPKSSRLKENSPEANTIFSYGKFCNIASFLISRMDAENAPKDSTCLSKLLGIDKYEIGEYFMPSLIFIGYQKVVNKRPSNIMFRYPAYNLSDDELNDYDMESRIWWKAATKQHKYTILFDKPDNIEGCTCGLTLPYPDIRGFLTRTFWCSKIKNANNDNGDTETTIYGIDFQLFPRK